MEQSPRRAEPIRRFGFGARHVRCALATVAWGVAAALALSALSACGAASREAQEPAPAAALDKSVYFGAGDDRTVTPIKHVIVIIGENRTFDHVYATYKPRPGQTVDN